MKKPVYTMTLDLTYEEVVKLADVIDEHIDKMYFSDKVVYRLRDIFGSLRDYIKKEEG